VRVGEVAFSNAHVARQLERLAGLLEIGGENPFKIRAYRTAAEVIEGLSYALEDAYASTGGLPRIAGVGPAIEAKIISMLKTGTFEALERARRDIPESVLEMLRVRGLGPARVRTLLQDKGVKSVEELAVLVEKGELAQVKGFSPETVSRVRRSLFEYMSLRGRVLRPPAGEVLADIKSHLLGLAGVERVEAAGSFRRARETVGNLDVLALGEPSAIQERLRTWKSAAGDPIRTGQCVRLAHFSGLEIRVTCVKKDAWGSLHWFLTGSAAHVGKLAERAADLGPMPDEESLYAGLGLQPVPPELREDWGEIELAAEGRLPRLLDRGDVRGDLHMHTTLTDGRSSMPEMARRARAMGYEYMAFTDHTKNVAVARGLGDERFDEYLAAVDEARNAVPGVTILAGLEVDILADGALDLPDELLSRLDLVIASVHSHFDQSEERVTARVLKAMANPNVHMLAHPSGRLIGQRSPLLLDLDKVLDAAEKLGVMLELNSNPERLDLSDEYCRKAAARGIPIVVSTDAHSVEQLENMRWGVDQGRRGWLEPGHVLNTLPRDELVARLASRRRRPGS